MDAKNDKKQIVITEYVCITVNANPNTSFKVKMGKYEAFGILLKIMSG